MSLVLHVKCKKCRGDLFYRTETRISVEVTRIEDDGRNCRDEYHHASEAEEEGLKKLRGAIPHYEDEYTCMTCGETYTRDELHKRQETSIS